jgi:chromosome segregation ATPase
MAYLVSHIAICLAFAQLLGLLLGWLLWGYTARQRGKEVQTLRERLADMHFMSARVTPAPEPRLALQDAPDVLSSSFQTVFSGSEMPERPAVRRAFFEESEEQPEPVRPSAPRQSLESASAAPPLAADLEAEVRESKIQHLQQQVRELEGFRDRLPLLQADLSDAIAGRRSAETRFQEAKNDFEVRASGLLSQIRDFEAAAAEWDFVREELERAKLSQEKELSAVKATLRDLQNSQRPQAVEAASGPSPSQLAELAELADLRERHQRVVREREALSAELSFWKQGGTGDTAGPARPSDFKEAELEEAVRSRDAQLSEQAARLESLLWRVAELEPFAAEAPQKEEALRRQESEIAGHMAMHAENASRIWALQNQLDELQSTSVPSDELNRALAEYQQRLADLEHSLSMKEQEIAEHVAVRYDQLSLLNALEARVDELEAAARQVPALEQALADRESEHRAAIQTLLRDREEQLSAVRNDLLQSHMESLDIANQHIKGLEQSIADRDIEIRALLSVHGDTQREAEAARNELLALRLETESQRAEHASAKARLAELESALSQQTAEIQQLRDLNNDKEGQLTFLHERLGSLSSRLAAHQQRLLQLEPLAARTPEVEEKLKSMESRHQAELTRLKVNSAQRIRRFRQSLNTFKT